MSTAIVPDEDLARISNFLTANLKPGLTHGTVEDYCAGFDLCPRLMSYNNDLKDSQRFWILKTILATQPRGATLLEVGAGEPVIADLLGRLGYKIIVVDPYEGAGNGPTSVDHFRKIYTNVDYIVDWFSPELNSIERGSIDCCYSISVIEHISLDKIETVVAGLRHFCKPTGSTIHAIDYVSLGGGADYHYNMFLKFVALLGYSEEDAVKSLRMAKADPDTYYLSAEAHNRWRGEVSYAHFPMRRVQSMQVLGWARK